jgi:hypothetical protein
MRLKGMLDGRESFVLKGSSPHPTLVAMLWKSGTGLQAHSRLACPMMNGPGDPFYGMGSVEA